MFGIPELVYIQKKVTYVLYGKTYSALCAL